MARVSYVRDRELIKTIGEAAQAFTDACQAALDAGLELDIDYDRTDDEAPTLDVEGRRWVARRVSKPREKADG